MTLADMAELDNPIPGARPETRHRTDLQAVRANLLFEVDVGRHAAGAMNAGPNRRPRLGFFQDTLAKFARGVDQRMNQAGGNVTVQATVWAIGDFAPARLQEPMPEFVGQACRYRHAQVATGYGRTNGGARPTARQPPGSIQAENLPGFELQSGKHGKSSIFCSRDRKYRRRGKPELTHVGLKPC